MKYATLRDIARACNRNEIFGKDGAIMLLDQVRDSAHWKYLLIAARVYMCATDRSYYEALHAESVRQRVRWIWLAFHYRSLSETYLNKLWSARKEVNLSIGVFAFLGRACEWRHAPGFAYSAREWGRVKAQAHPLFVGESERVMRLFPLSVSEEALNGHTSVSEATPA